jgi:uncharacterized protein YprB with RNaseH-like and TPR domain
VPADLVSELRSRLESLGRGAGTGVRPPRKEPERVFPKGFEPVATPFGTAWRWAEVLPEGRIKRGRPTPELAGVDPDGFAYLDTETTGLAGGTGTYAFAAAIARPVGGGVRLVQLLLAEPAAEPAFLFALDEELQQADGLATYNGAAFDLPLLRTRWLMARMAGTLTEPPHLDLLHLGRALLKARLGDCTLRHVEDRLLGFDREEDIAGELIPRCYFDWLRHGYSPDLEAALEHNRQDVLSLQHLLHRLLHRLRGADPTMDGRDWLALARYLHRKGRRSAAWRAFHAAARQGEPAAILALARRKAVVLEWRLKRPAAALSVVDAALARLGPEPDLERRRLRLRKRLDDADRRRRGSQHGAQPVALADQRRQRLDDGRVVGVPGVLGDPIESFQRAGARRRQLLVPLADGEDAGEHRDLLPGQPVRAAVTVPALVVVTDEGHQLG